MSTVNKEMDQEARPYADDVFDHVRYDTIRMDAQSYLGYRAELREMQDAIELETQRENINGLAGIVHALLDHIVKLEMAVHWLQQKED
jgi:polyhydroxyalkanoate synthesis regulator phasin